MVATAAWFWSRYLTTRRIVLTGQASAQAFRAINRTLVFQSSVTHQDVSANSGVFDQLFGESAIDHDAISYVRDAGMITR